VKIGKRERTEGTDGNCAILRNSNIWGNERRNKMSKKELSIGDKISRVVNTIAYGEMFEEGKADTHAMNYLIDKFDISAEDAYDISAYVERLRDIVKKYDGIY